MVKHFVLLAVVFASLTSAATSVRADRLDEMISPVSNPVNFEDPRSNTEARLIHMYHEIDNDFITSGGDVQVYALQLRYAINDRLAIIATKDGLIDFNPDENLEDDEGLANVAGGLKYAFWRDPEAGQIMTMALRYETPVGDEEVFQGNGDGFIQPSLSAGFTVCDNVNFMGATGLRLAMDNSDSSFWDLDFHVDYKFDTAIGAVHPLLEANLVQVIDAGDRLPIADEGLDLISFGSSEADGKTVVTGAVGARLVASDSVALGVAYQFPFTQGAGSNLFDWRVTTDLIISFDI